MKTHILMGFALLKRASQKVNAYSVIISLRHERPSLPAESPDDSLGLTRIARACLRRQSRPTRQRHQ